ncbi:MAG TPA: glycosyltransferase [Acidimicrobiia bacterium]|nr:glycosyltransferase [Acidimicrobiia bacterium]
MSSVSVVIPCYNYAHYLRGCVESVLSQEGVDVQVLIIDDASSDDTAGVATDLARDARVTFWRHEQNRGHIATYNEGLAWASCDYTLLLSADDMLVPGALRRAAGALDTYPSAGLAYGRSLLFAENDALPPARTGEPRVDRWSGRDWIEKRCETATGCISSPEAVVRTSVQHAVGGYRPELTATGDTEMWMRFAARGDVLFLGGVDQAYYRRHPQSMSQTTYSAALVDLQQHRAAFDAVFDDPDVVIADRARLQEKVHRVLARKALRIACRAYDRRRIDRVPVDDLEAFALETCASAKRLPEYRALQRRRALGPRVAPLLAPFALFAYVAWVRDKLWWRRWALKGV